MALPFENEITISSNPFLDILMKNLKVLAYNCIIKDEYEANLNETEYSFSRAEIYIACIENTITLGMFSEAGIVIPDTILNAVFVQKSEKDIIKLYKNFGNDISWIPKDVDDKKIHNENDTYSRSNYREQLLIRLKTWFLQSYEEQNDYYRMICGLPSLNSWGIPIRDYISIIPEYLLEKCSGDFLHELDKDIIQELDSFGIIDIIRMEYPNEKYLNYITATLDLYEVRKKADLHILWLPPDSVVDTEIKKDFESKYNERRDIVIKTIYSSAFELQSQFYHATMIIYILTMTILDMIAELQIHIIKRDILDRRCVEYLFSQKGVTYYKDIPYQYQQRLCDNLHNLIKYKGSIKDILLIKSLFGFNNDEDISLYQYYLMKVRNYDESGNFVLNGENKLISKQNDIINHYIEFEDFNKNTEECIVNNSTHTWIKKIIFYPYDNYENKDVVFVISLNDKILKEYKDNHDDSDYFLDKDETLKYYKYIYIKKDIFNNNEKIIKIDYYVDELVENVLDSNNDNINLKMFRINNYSNKHNIPITEVLPFSYSYLNIKDKLSVIVGDYYIDKKINPDVIKISHVNNNTYSIKININENNYPIMKINSKTTDPDSVFNIKLYKDKYEKNIYYILQENGFYENDNNKYYYYDLYKITKEEKKIGIIDDNEVIINYTIEKYNNYFTVKNLNKENENYSYWILSTSFKNNLSAIEYIIPDNNNNDRKGDYRIKVNNTVKYYIKEDKDTKTYVIIDLKENYIDYIQKIYLKKIELYNNNGDFKNSIDKELLVIISNYLLTKKNNKSTENYVINLDNDSNYIITKNNDYSNSFSINLNQDNKIIEINKFKTGFEFDIENNILKIDGDISIKNKDIYISYFESNNYDVRYYKKEINNSDIIIQKKDNVDYYKILIPEPESFSNYYIKNDNTFYLTLIHIKNDNNESFAKTTERFIKLDNTDYYIESDNNKYYINIKINKLEELNGNNNSYYDYYKLAFNFIYTSDNIINDFNLQKLSLRLPIEYKNQLEFLLDNENIVNMTDNNDQFTNFKNNDKTICAMYVKYKDNYFIANLDFSYNNSSIMFNDDINIEYIKNSKNNFLDVLIIYYLKENSFEYSNVNILQQSIQIKNHDIRNEGTDIYIDFPIENCLLTKDNIINYESNKLALYLDSFGVPLIKENKDYDFYVDNNTGKLHLKIYKINSIIDNVINIIYIYNNINVNKIIPNLIEFKFDIKNINKLINDNEKVKKYNLNLIQFSNKENVNKQTDLDLNTEILNNNKINLCYTEDSGKKEIKVIENLNSLQVIFKNTIFNSSNIVFEENVDNNNYIIQNIVLQNLNDYLFKSNINNEYLLMNFLYFYIENYNDVENKEVKFITDKISINIQDFTKISNNKIEKYIIDDINNSTTFRYPKNYFDNQWPYYITIKTLNEEETLISEDDYDLINGYLYIYNIKLDSSLSADININFIYKIKDNYMYEQYMENYDENIKLEFCRIPINENLDVTKYLADKKNWIDYDSFVSSDNWWYGNKYKNNYNNIIKEKIYQSNFNIVKTKYYSLQQNNYYNNYSKRSTFFNSMLYDNTMLTFGEKNDGSLINENDMRLNVNSISLYSDFYISHLFIYIICLSDIYNNKNLSYIQHSDNLNPLYIMGFNFNITSDTIKTELKFKYNVKVPDSEIQDPNVSNKDFLNKLYNFFNKFNFGTSYNYDSNYTLFEQFILIFNENMAAYEYLCEELLETENYNEFQVWEYLYYKLMTSVYDSSYFKIEKDTKLAETYEEFLKDQSEILYNNLQTIKNIYDTDTKVDIITDYIEQIEQALEDLLKNNPLLKDDIDFYKSIIRIYTGNFATLKVSYMKKILEFFKSYKIFIKDTNTNINFDNNETEENSYRIYEKIIFFNIYHFSEYYGINEKITIKDKNNKVLETITV